EAAIPAGVKVTNRISPGYAGWDTAEQSALFALCAGEPIGVTLNASCVMTPAKSISFLVGVGPAARVDHYFTQCRRCWMRECAYRRGAAPAPPRREGGGRGDGGGGGGGERGSSGRHWGGGGRGRPPPPAAPPAPRPADGPRVASDAASWKRTT